MKKTCFIKFTLAVLLFSQARLHASPPLYNPPMNSKIVHDLLNSEPRPTLQSVIDGQKNEIVKGIFKVTVAVLELPLMVLACIAPALKGSGCP